MSRKQEKILICGGGLAGMASALGLKKNGFEVELLAPREQPLSLAPEQYHPRVYALSVASQQFLDGLGVWGLMPSERITAVQAMQVFGDASGEITLDAWQIMRDELAWIVESGTMEQALLQALQVFGVRWHDALFESFHNDGSRGRGVMTACGQFLPADLVVGADGARSKVRTAAHIQHDFYAYGDSGIVTHLDAQLPHQGIARQWFTGDSILALLPMPETSAGPQVSMVWSVKQALADELMGLDPDARAQQLEQHLQAMTDGCLGALTVRSPMYAFPLTFERSAMVAPGVALVGDAAHRVHPLAGQGLNLGFGDIEELIHVLCTKPAYQGVGDLSVLSRYRRKRAEPIFAMRWVTHGLHQFFGLPGLPAMMARNVGMRLVNRVPLIKRLLIQEAAGIAPQFSSRTKRS
ncbi:MAG TPA: FAD-dependent monooxygenase [Paenalcaligenes sp.]|nr:FAD-dependent monooxygenase [Paenalcaligenes sp.]